MRQPTPLPPILRSPAFSVAAARQAGVSPQRLRRSDLRAPFHGARVAADGSQDVVGRCIAYRSVMAANAFFSHATAATLYGLPLPVRMLGDRLHVSTVLPSRAPKGKGVIGHALTVAPELRIVAGLRVPAPAEVWCQLAAALTVDELVLAGDGLLRRLAPLCDDEELARTVVAASGRPGIARLRTAAELVRSRTDSPMESVLRLALIRAGMPEPVVNHPIQDGTGRIRASADLAYPAAALAVEYDSDHHRTDAEQYHTDIDRLFLIESLGWRVIRITKEHMRNGASIAVARIRAALETSGPNMPPTPET